MIYWVGLFLLECLLFYCYNRVNSKKNKNIVLWSIILSLVYFSGFRDGLGMDYDGYRELCEREVYNFLAFYLSEPIFRALQSFCYNTDFSAVILFLISAFLVCACSLYVYSKFANFTLSAFVFIFFSDIYLSSMNLVSQFAAAGVILLGYYPYIREKNPKNLQIAIGSVFCGMLLHLSSLFMLLPLLFGRKRINVLLWVLFIVVSYFIPVEFFFRLPIIEHLVTLLNYQNYFTYTSSGTSSLSMTNIYMHLLLFPFLVRIKRITQSKHANEYIFLIKMYAMYLILNNFSTGNFTITYRLAVFFVLFLPLLLSKLPMIVNKQIAYGLIIFPILFLMLFRLSSGDRLIVPDRILPIESVYDKYYRPYENPNL